MSAAFVRHLRSLLMQALEERGFERYRKDWADAELAQGFRLWTSVVDDRSRAEVVLVPFVGVHALEVEKVAALEQTGQFPAAYERNRPTWSANAGAIDELAGTREFRFAPGDGDSRTLREMDRLADFFAGPVLASMRRCASYRRLADLLRPHVGQLGGIPQRYLACLLLDGRHSEAKQFVDAIPEEHRPYLQHFIEPFLAQLGTPETRH